MPRRQPKLTPRQIRLERKRQRIADERQHRRRVHDQSPLPLAAAVRRARWSERRTFDASKRDGPDSLGEPLFWERAWALAWRKWLDVVESDRSVITYRLSLQPGRVVDDTIEHRLLLLKRKRPPLDEDFVGVDDVKEQETPWSPTSQNKS